MTRQEKINKTHMKMVYIAHPFSGLPENITDSAESPGLTGGISYNEMIAELD